MNELKIELVPVEKLTPHPKNPKKHPPEQVKALAETIRRQGWDQPIVVTENFVVLKGHGRRLADQPARVAVFLFVFTFRLRQVVLFTVDEHHDVRVLLDGSRFAQMAQLRQVVA